MNWLFYALLSSIFFTSYNLLNKYLVGHKKFDSTNFIINRLFISTIMGLVIVVLLRAWPTAVTPNEVIFLLIGGVIFAAGNYYFLKSFTETPISDITMINSLQPLFALGLGIVLLSESINAYKLIGTLLIVFSIMLVFVHRKRMVFDKGHLHCLIGVVLYSIGAMVDGYMTRHWPVWFYLTMGGFTVGVFLLFTGQDRIPRSYKLFKQSPLLLSLSSAFAVAAIYCLLTAYSLGEVSLGLPVSYLSSILTVVGGFVLFKETNHVKRKVFATAMIIAGIFLISR